MSTKRLTRKQQRGQSSRNASSPADNESVEDAINALARAGYITMTASGDDITLSPVPDPLRVLDTVAPEEELAADTELFEQRRLPARIEKLLRRDAFGLWEHFKRIWLVPLLENATGESFATIWKRIERHAPETAARDLVFGAMLGGFDFALVRYDEQLKRIPELAEWRQDRKKGGDKGRQVLMSKKVDLAQRIRDKWATMEAAGENPTNASVAAAIKKECGRGSVRTVQRAFTESAEKTTPGKQAKR